MPLPPAIGAVLYQVQDDEKWVNTYGSRSLSKSQQVYCNIKCDLLAVVYFTKHFRSYMTREKFNRRTDHASLCWLVNFDQTEMLLR
jgi:hypothetical protein